MSEQKSASSQNEKKPSVLQLLVRMLRHLILHNTLQKVIAIVISVILWAGLVSQDESLTRDKSFQEINVSVTGAETMRNNGYIVVSDLEELLKDVSITAAVPQKQYENADASAYNVRVDLSRINGTGEQELKILNTNSTAFGKVVSTNPSSVLVSVEDYIVRQRIPVSVTVNGDVPEEWYMSTPSVDPALVAVSGPRSLVETISRARAYVDTSEMDWDEKTHILNSTIKLYNRSGEEVDSKLVKTTSGSLTIDNVLIETTILPKLSFGTSEMIALNGSVAKGYEITDVKVSPESVWVAARQDVLEQMSELPMERNINVRNLNETTVFQLKVQKPSEDAVLSNETVTVTVVVEAKED